MVSPDHIDIVAENIKTEWDLAFENNQEGWRIILNSSTFSKSSEIKNLNFEDVITTENINWMCDDPKGINYGTSIGDYRNNKYVYIIDTDYYTIDTECAASTARTYNGKTDINRLHIKLLDQYGRPVDLNDMDF